MPTHLPVRLSTFEKSSRLSLRAFAALMLWAVALIAFTLPTAAHHDGDTHYVEAQP